MTVVSGRLLLCSDRALTERRGHNFLSLKAWSCGQVVCLWDSICPGEAGEHLFQICTLMIYKLIVSLNEFIFFFTLFFPKICMSININSNLETLITPLPLLLTSLPI